MAPAHLIRKQRSDDRVIRQEVVAGKRRNSIQEREAERLAALEQQRQKQAQERQLVSTKYPKQDVLHLKQIFDTYDADGSGCIDRRELKAALQKQKGPNERFDGKRKTLAERQAQQGKVQGQGHHKQGVFLVDFCESCFRAMDANSDGRVDFEELLRLIYPFATELELQTMLVWVYPPAKVQAFEEFQLSDQQRRECHSMFVLYDKDKSGGISHTEFRHAMRRCGLDAEEIEATFAEADLDGNRTIDLHEFTLLMKRTLFENHEKLTFSTLYGPI